MCQLKPEFWMNYTLCPCCSRNDAEAWKDGKKKLSVFFFNKELTPELQIPFFEGLPLYYREPGCGLKLTKEFVISQ